MRFYFGGCNSQHKELLKSHAKNLLITIHNNRNFMEQFKRIGFFDKPYKYNILIDNGAFSAWNSSTDIITIEEYTEFIHTFMDNYKDYFADIHFVALDDIPGERNRKPTEKEIKDSIDTTFCNFRYLLENDIYNSIPVIHQHEDPDLVNQYAEYTDFICVSPANDLPTSTRCIWMDKIFNEVLKHPGMKTHGLAATSYFIAERYPWFSMDSISWKNPTIFARYKHLRIYEYMQGNLKDLLNKYLLNPSSTEIWELKNILGYVADIPEGKKRDGVIGRTALKYTIDYFIDLENFFTKVWEMRGIKYNA